MPMIKQITLRGGDNMQIIEILRDLSSNIVRDCKDDNLDEEAPARTPYAPV